MENPQEENKHFQTCKHCGSVLERRESMMVVVKCVCSQEDLACIDRPTKLAQTQFEEIKEEWHGTVCEVCGKKRRVFSAEHKIFGE